MHGLYYDFNNLRDRQSQNINGCSAVHVIMYVRSSEIMKCRLLKLYPMPYTSYRCLWKKHILGASPCLAIPQQKLLSSPWFGAPKAYLPICVLRPRIVFSQTPLGWSNNYFNDLHLIIVLEANKQLHVSNTQYQFVKRRLFEMMIKPVHEYCRHGF